MRKAKSINILLILTLTTSLILVNQSSFAAAMEPAKLKIYAGPAGVPADNNIYECIFVQLQDSSSAPARALQDTTISLSSSLTSVGDVDHTITISKGNTFAVAKFHSTFTPGTTAIAATASGYATVQTNLITVAPVPYKLAVYGFPPVLPSDGVPYDALVVQLQDSSSNPAKAPLQGIQVTLSSSDSAVASVPASVIISGGQTSTMASVTSNAPGSATITALTSGYASAQATITAQQPSTTPPQSLRIYVAPPKTLADNTTNPQIVVQLLNATGKITQQPSTPTTIQLTSSNENVGKVQSTLAIPTGKVYATATFSATYKAGATTITAAATDLNSDTENINTIGPIPSKLAVYCTPSTVPADNKAYNAVQVQLQDSSGKPALDPDGDVTVSLFSSEPTVGTVPTTLTIPFGKVYATATFTSTNMASQTTITAQASGYTTGQAKLTTFLIDLSALTVAVTANPEVIASGKQTNITAYVTYDGTSPALGATVKFTSNNGGTFSTTKDQGNGHYTSVFTAPSFTKTTNCTITATASKTGYETQQGTTQLTVETTSMGILQICIKDNTGNPVEDALVTSIAQPAGMKTITGTTNQTGYVTFTNAIQGSYTMKILKTGYLPANQTINFTGQTVAPTLFISRSSADGSDSNLLLIAISIVAVVVIVVTIVFVIMVRRKKAARFKLPPQFQKHNNPPPIGSAKSY